MSIPLDRLYHYIESVAQEILSDNVLIYRFFPHGSKKFTDISIHEARKNYLEMFISPQVFCNDQEPLNFELYRKCVPDVPDDVIVNLRPHMECNIRLDTVNLFDQCVILHSEKNSHNVELYRNNGFVPAYYWNHAFLALDWYRYAQHVKPLLPGETTFLIYNRAWTGTREYRLKFAEMLVQNQLLDQCKTSVQFTDSNIHYQDHSYVSNKWRPNIDLEKYFVSNDTTPCYSADFDINDYNQTQIEVVLETLVDDERWHLTEKTLRPIALGQPFLLCATAGSLQYLKSYGFKTFDSVINETYDTIKDPLERMASIIETMKEISQWTPTQRINYVQQMQEIALYNKQRFFSAEFLDQIQTELKENLRQALTTVVDTNTYSRYINLKQVSDIDEKFVNWRLQTYPEYHLKALKELDQYVLTLPNWPNK